MRYYDDDMMISRIIDANNSAADDAAAAATAAASLAAWCAAHGSYAGGEVSQALDASDQANAKAGQVAAVTDQAVAIVGSGTTDPGNPSNRGSLIETHADVAEAAANDCTQNLQVVQGTYKFLEDGGSTASDFGALAANAVTTANANVATAQVVFGKAQELAKDDASQASVLAEVAASLNIMKDQAAAATAAQQAAVSATTAGDTAGAKSAALRAYAHAAGTDINLAVVQDAIATRVDESAVSFTTTGTVNSLVIGAASVVYFDGSADVTINGVPVGADEQEFELINRTTKSVFFNHDNSSGPSGGHFKNIATSMPTPLGAGGRARFRYDESSGGQWRLVSHEQGDWIDYQPTSTKIGWSSFVSGGAVLKYKLSGTKLDFQFYFNGASNSASISFTLPGTTPTMTGGGASKSGTGSCIAYDNTAYLSQPGSWQAADNSKTILVYPSQAGGSWTASGTKYVAGQGFIVVT